VIRRVALCIVSAGLISCSGPTVIGPDKACSYQRIVVLSLLPQKVRYRRVQAGGKEESLDIPVGMLLNEAAWTGVRAAFRSDEGRELVIFTEDLEHYRQKLEAVKFGVAVRDIREELVAFAAARNADAVLLLSRYIHSNRGIRGIDGLFYLGLGDKQYVTASADVWIELYDRNGQGIVESRSEGVLIPVKRVDGASWTFDLRRDTDVVGHRSFTQTWQRVLPRVIEARIQRMGLPCSKGTQLGDLKAEDYARA